MTYWIQVGSKSTDRCPYNKVYEDTQGKWQCEVGGKNQSLAAIRKETPKPPEAERGKKEVFPRAFRGSMALSAQ